MAVDEVIRRLKALESHMSDHYVHVSAEVRNETLTGTADGANTLFKMDKVAEPNDTLMVFVNGAYKKRDVDYTHAGIAVEMTTAPASGVAVMAFYRYNPFKLHEFLKPELISAQQGRRRRRRNKPTTHKRGAVHPAAVLV
jgi:hypothetical protein